MNLRQIEAFVKIANNNSFSRTARELHLTQPTVSAYITSFEEELGVRLFARTTKSVELTEDGKKIFLYAQEMLELSDKILRCFCPAENAAAERQIVISASSIPAQYVLPKILSEFSRMYPLSRFRVTESDSSGVVRDITEHLADVGFTGTAFPGRNCEYTPFYEDELIIITPNTAKYRALRNAGDSLNWITEEPFILRENGSGTRREAVKNLQKIGIQEDALRVIAHFGNTGAILTSVKEGVGIAAVSRLAAQEIIDRGELLDFRLSDGGCYRKLYMVTSSVHSHSDSAQKLINLVKKRYAAAV